MIMLKILLADADRIFLELGKTFLRKTGVEVFTCMNGEEVLSIMRKERPDLVIFVNTYADLDRAGMPP
jgi:CheY-like chemotaxis protein